MDFLFGKTNTSFLTSMATIPEHDWEDINHTETSVEDQFNPFAGRAATISLSGFGPLNPYGFNRFQKRKKKIERSKEGESKQESATEQWLRFSNCPIARSCRAVSQVLPLVVKPPSGVQFSCPKAVVAARSALAKTGFAKNLRPQPLPAKILAIGCLGTVVNVPLGAWREHTEKFSASWFVAAHAAVPVIGMLRKSVLMPKTAMAYTIAASMLGQIIGSRAERYRLEMVATKRNC
ncbi:hypothetical protein CASFOL_009293 [Castilleja foliolosa]|uniref:Uncharacterized protein n=1 Tax=Castilleja foliolosa TaxID=1961234 RepID=A0ABD3E136_9LAMI